MDNWRTDLGPLAGLVTSDTRDLCVDGSGRVWTDSGPGFRDSGVVLDPGSVRRIGVSLIDSAGGRVDDARPIGDSAFAGNVRAHLVLPPVARDGPLLSLRFAQTESVGLTGFTCATAIDLAEIARRGTLIAGVTGSGKTTLATAMLDALPQAQRVVIVEDLAEMNPRHPHTVHLTTRTANADGGGAVGLADLVRESLRMRPDSVVVGEIRGPEIREFLAAATSGHHTVATIHAGSIEQVAARVMTLALLAGVPRSVVAELVESAIPSVTFCRRTDRGFTVSTGRFVAERKRLRVVSE